MTVTSNSALDELLGIFKRMLPLRSGNWELSLRTGENPALWLNENGLLFASILLATFESEAADALVNTVKEQDVYLGKYADYAPGRWAAFLEGHLRALPTIARELGPDIEAILPFEFFMYPEPLADDTLQSTEDFFRAMSNAENLRTWNRAHLHAEWKEMLEPCGLGEHVDEVRAMGRAALRMLLEKVEVDEVDDEARNEAERLIGESRVGGHPDVPASFIWPEAGDEPLTFIAQINLREIAKFRNIQGLPGDGLLSFFCSQIPTEGSRGHGARVFHFPNLDELEWRVSPKEVEPISEYLATFKEERVFPSIESHFHYESLLPESAVLPFYESLRDGCAGEEPVTLMPLSNFLSCVNDVYDHERPTHRLLGHPDSIQGDPYLDMEIEMRENRWHDWNEGSSEAYQIRKNALRWRLLLQIDAQEADELLINQDGGFFYFFIPEDALARQDWTEVQGMMQCH